MPTYTYCCPKCGAQDVIRRPVENRDAPVWCMDCDENMPRLLEAPMVNMNGQEAAK